MFFIATKTVTVFDAETMDVIDELDHRTFGLRLGEIAYVTFDEEGDQDVLEVHLTHRPDRFFALYDDDAQRLLAKMRDLAREETSESTTPKPFTANGIGY